MIKKISFIFILLILGSPILATNISCSFTEKNADYNMITGNGIINYNDVLFSLDDNKKTITHTISHTPLEVILYNDKFLKFKLNLNTEDSENSYIIAISRINGAIKTEHHRKLKVETYNPLSAYLKDSPKYSTHIVETDFYGNGFCSKQTTKLNKF